MKVFLSSVFQTLVDVRAAVHVRLQTLGFDVWCAENHPQLRGAPAHVVRAACLAGVEESDIYLGVFPVRYGSDPLSLSFTELEYHHAVALGKPRLLYQLRREAFVTENQRIKQRAFLHLLFDKDITLPLPKFVRSKQELLEAIAYDLEPLSSKGTAETP